LADGSVDLVCSFALLHHVRNPDRIVSEMLRVAKKAIFISDSNNFGQGTYLARSIKQLINALGLWPAANYVKTRGKGYSVLEGDGITYSYSVFNSLPLIKQNCQTVHIVNTEPAGVNPYRTAPTVAVLGVKSTA
jgi:SAM-dependent methyltransferase